CTRTQGSRRAPSGRGRSLAGEDVRERLDVDGVQDAPPLRLLQPGYELGPQDVDLSVQQPPAIRHLLLLAREVVDQLLQILVGQCRKIRQRFHRALSSRVKLNFSLCPRLEQKRYVRAAAASPCSISSTRARSSRASSSDSSRVPPSA